MKILVVGLVTWWALAGCSKDNPGPEAKMYPGIASSFNFEKPKQHRVRFKKTAVAKVWLRFDCKLTSGEFELKGKVGFRIPGGAAVAPVPLKITRAGVTATGLPRTRDGIVGLRERTFEGARHLSGYAYLFDLPATNELVTIEGSVAASGAVCADGLGQSSWLQFTQ